MDYDNQFDYFTYVELVALYSRKAYPKIDSFKLAMQKFYSDVHNKYFDTYITYTIAALEEKTKLSDKKLFSNYISGKPIMYSNPEYMNFFNAFYKQKIQNFALSKEGFPLGFQINDRGSLPGVINILNRDPFMKNDTIAELVLLKGLYESYYDGSFKRGSIIAILQQISTDSRVAEHRQIAINILNSFSKLKAGSAAPFFELPDKNGVTHSLDELRVKNYIYLMFYDAGCTSCLEQMKVITAFKKQYGERITFVSVSTDKSNAELKNFCAKNPKFDWLFLYDNTNGQLKSNYEIKSMPEYFLINPDGKFVQVPAESPDGEIDRAFFDIVKPKTKLHNIGGKQN
jgi:peroxiredoxin